MHLGADRQCVHRRVSEVLRPEEAEVEEATGTMIGAIGRAATRLSVVHRRGDGGARATTARAAVRHRGGGSEITALREVVGGGGARATLTEAIAVTGATVGTEAEGDTDGKMVTCGIAHTSTFYIYNGRDHPPDHQGW